MADFASGSSNVSGICPVCHEQTMACCNSCRYCEGHDAACPKSVIGVKKT